jgi:uncharacterized protein (TIGR01370 family)
MRIICACIIWIFSSLLADDKFLVYYGEPVGIDKLKPFKWMVLEPQHQQVTMRTLSSEGRGVFGYLNLCEVEQGTLWFERLKSLNLLLVENENWPGSYMIDVRSLKYVKMVIEEIIPYILFQGFNGLFLDTIDNAEYLESLDKRYAGMQEATIKLIKGIRLHYPEVLLMANRGFSLTHAIGGQIDALLGEGIFTEFNFKDKSYFWTNEQDRQEAIHSMHEAQKLNPKLQLFSLDYWNQNEPHTVEQIYQIARKEGFIPYVSQVELNKIYEPHP